MELQRQANKIWWGHHQRVGHLENRLLFTVIRIQFLLILARGWAAGQKVLAVSGSVSGRVYVLQCVTSGKLLSADLHNTVFPLSLPGKTRPFCKTAKGQNMADGSAGPEALVATVGWRECGRNHKSAVLTVVNCGGVAAHGISMFTCTWKAGSGDGMIYSC